MAGDDVDGTNRALFDVSGISADDGSAITVQLSLQQAMNDTLEGRFWAMRHPVRTADDAG